MEPRNQTFISGFILQRLFNQTEQDSIIFSILLTMYLLILLGNLLIVFLIHCDAHLLHTPMYFFLSFLSLADVGFASTTVPMILHTLVSQTKIISYGGCLSQIYFYLAFGNSDNFLLVTMAYDRYVAICHPLHYTMLMSHKRCLLLVSVCWLLAFLQAMYTVMLSRLSFCASQKIPYFFCDFYPLVGLSCSDTTTLKMVALTEDTLDIFVPFVGIVVSYACIFLAIMKTPSSTGKRKAFSTCGSHLIIVVLFYGTICWINWLSNSKPSNHINTLAALMYNVVTPMLNPFIYSLRNKEIKGALRRLVDRRPIF